MNFVEVLEDIQKLEGLELCSIRPGAEIVIEKVDKEQGKIIIRNKGGKRNSRPVAQFEKIWEELISFPAIHVDEVLHGSGSSRNQPETILANLPYIEWLKVNNKKHIAYVGKATHAFGTIKRVDGICANKISEKLISRDKFAKVLSLISTREIYNMSQAISKLCGKKPISLSKTMYLYVFENKHVVLVDSDKTGIPMGTYCEIAPIEACQYSTVIDIQGKKWGILCVGELNGIVPL